MHPFFIPAPLRQGDRIRIIAPAGAVPQDAFDTGLRLIEAAGFVPVYDEALFVRHRYFAGPHPRRQKELLAALHEADTRAIWAARGGYGTGRLLAPVDAELVHAHPKWLVGFSDLTSLHAAYQKAQMLSIHGANVTTLGSWLPQARGDLFELLTAQGSQTKSMQSKLRWRKTFAGAKAKGPPGAASSVRGRLWGGNLTVLASLCGTGQLPQAERPEPTVLLLEEIGEAPYRLDRCWHQLEASGAFRHVVGVALGQLTHCEAKGADYSGLEMLTDAIEACGLPWVSGLPFGHADDAEAVPLGAIASLDVRTRQLSVQL